MPLMTYLDYTGKDYRFKKGERVPQWLFKSEVTFFDTDVLVIPLENKVYIFGKPSVNEALIRANNYNGEESLQVCPQISFYTNQEIYVA